MLILLVKYLSPNKQYDVDTVKRSNLIEICKIFEEKKSSLSNNLINIHEFMSNKKLNYIITSKVHVVQEAESTFFWVLYVYTIVCTLFPLNGAC